MRNREIEDEIIEELGRDARLDERRQHIERLGRQTPGFAHAFESLRTV